ncbi:MAG: PilN domain-containing protein [Phycisphaerales bacterium]|nr:MAG: PilN domain-containing protein [Phycisphaerales bacterium]
MDNTSFLPEDYLAQKAERRTNIISLLLFGVVMIGVFGAFLVTNQQWSQVKAQQQTINMRYQTAAEQIEDLIDLQEQKKAMLNRAELSAALVERVPRSILLAELINRMPPRLSLLEFELKSEKIKTLTSPVVKAGQIGNLKDANRAPTKEEAAEQVKKIEPPRYRVDLTLVGVAPSDLEVSRYMAVLNTYELVRNVRLDYSEDREIDGRLMRQFSIAMSLDPAADVRSIEPLILSRGSGNPMSDQLILSAPGTRGAAGSGITFADPGNPGEGE